MQRRACILSGVSGLCIAALVLLLQPSVSLAAKRLVLASGANAPLVTAQGDGFLNLFLKDVFRRIGYQVRIDPLPPERALRNANEGIDDGDAYRVGGLGARYPNLVQVPAPTLDMRFFVFSKRTLAVNQGWASLFGESVGYIRGWKIVQTKLTGRCTLTSVDDRWALFRLLERDHADVIVYGAWQGLYVRHVLGLRDIQLDLPPLSVNRMYLYLNKRYQALVPGVAAAIREAKADGTFDRIYAAVLAPLMD